MLNILWSVGGKTLIRKIYVMEIRSITLVCIN